MSRRLLARLLSLSLVLVLAACAAYQAQHQRPAASPGSPVDTAVAPAPVSPPGEFTELPVDLQIGRIRGEMSEVKGRLAQQGNYACCVDPPCNQCLLKFGRCRCREGVRHHGAFCGECAEGWKEGRGIVEGVDAKELLGRDRQSPGEAKPEGSEPPPEHQHHHH
jgi:hypothetical protein